MAEHVRGRAWRPDEAAICADARAGLNRTEIARRQHVPYNVVKAVLIRNGLGHLQTVKRWGAIYPDDPHGFLALAIIEAACQDWRKGRYPYWGGVSSPTKKRKVRDEVRRFAHSDWFEVLCELGGISAEAVRECNGVS